MKSNLFGPLNGDFNGEEIGSVFWKQGGCECCSADCGGARDDTPPVGEFGSD